VACLAESRDAGAMWVARSDIDDCFDHIPRWEVVRRLREVIHDVAAVDLVRQFMDRPVIGERVALSDRGLGLHQGSPLSPLLCNLYLDAFGRAMLRLGYRPIRYTDDIAIPATDRGEAERALADARTELADLRLDMDPVKSQVYSFDAGVPFLGTTRYRADQPGSGGAVAPRGDGRIRGQDRQSPAQPGDRLLVEHNGPAVFKLNFKRVRQVVCVGRVGMTIPFLQRALRDGIDVMLLDGHGGPGGRLASLAHSARRRGGRSTGQRTRVVLDVAKPRPTDPEGVEHQRAAARVVRMPGLSQRCLSCLRVARGVAALGLKSSRGRPQVGPPRRPGGGRRARPGGRHCGQRLGKGPVRPPGPAGVPGRHQTRHSTPRDLPEL